MIELFQLFKEGIGTSLVYGKVVTTNKTLVYYLPNENAVIFSETLEKANDAKLIGMQIPTLLERVPELEQRITLEKPSENGFYVTNLRTTLEKGGKLELRIKIHEEINNIIRPRDSFSIHIGDMFDYDLLRGNIKK